MSLVNELLKDLEKRESGGALAVGAVPGSFAVDCRESESSTSVKSNYYLLVGVLFLFSVSIAFFVGGKLSIKDKVADVLESNSALINASNNTEQLTSQVQFISDEMANTAENSTVNILGDILPLVSKPPLLEEDYKKLNVESALPKELHLNTDIEAIQQLLVDAEVAFERDRLTEPFEDNALSRYEAILEIDPENNIALAGLKAIVNQYLDFQSISINKGNLSRAASYLAKAETVADVHPSIQQWYQRLEKNDDQTTVIAAITAEPISSKQQKINVKQEHQVGNPQSSISVKPSVQSIDNNHSQHADYLIKSNQYHTAQSYLEKVLAENPELPLSREKLFEIYLLQKHTEQAKAQLNFIQGHKRAYLAARLEVAFNQWNSAASLLEEFSPPVQSATQYYALLAAVYVQLSRHQDSIAIYQKLLSYDQQQSTYWLGLATAYDALGEYGEALKAFRYSRLYGGLDATTHAYVEKRIQQLNNSVRAG